MHHAYRVALLCGMLPLLVGISIFLLWLITRWEWLMMAGAYTIQGGVVVLFIGAIALNRYFWLARRSSAPARQRLWRSTLGLAALLLSNIVAAGAFIVSAIAIDTLYTVVVHNPSSQKLASVRVYGGGCDADFGSVPAGTTARRRFWIQHDGTLELRLEREYIPRVQRIDDYVTHGIGAHTEVTVDASDNISVVKTRN